ncbi:MAG: hypothetical protein AB1578_11610 [Thermodesulfobacteriota bacterium]
MADPVYYTGGLVLIVAVVASFLFAWRMDRKEARKARPARALPPKH